MREEEEHQPIVRIARCARANQSFRALQAGLSLARQRENALLYVRGLIEQGGRKSLQPTLFRLEETPARYESMQQFLADPPWQPDAGAIGCL